MKLTDQEEAQCREAFGKHYGYSPPFDDLLVDEDWCVAYAAGLAARPEPVLGELPPLPSYAISTQSWIGDNKPRQYYTAEQMTEYGKLCLSQFPKREPVIDPRQLLNHLPKREGLGRSGQTPLDGS